jgi:hypothetical protein
MTSAEFCKLLLCETAGAKLWFGQSSGAGKALVGGSAAVVISDIAAHPAGYSRNSQRNRKSLRAYLGRRCWCQAAQDSDHSGA